MVIVNVWVLVMAGYIFYTDIIPRIREQYNANQERIALLLASKDKEDEKQKNKISSQVYHLDCTRTRHCLCLVQA